MTNWVTIEVGKLRDAERLREAARERLANQAGAGQARHPLALSKAVAPLGAALAAVLGRRMPVWGTHLQPAASPCDAAADSQCKACCVTEL